MHRGKSSAGIRVPARPNLTRAKKSGILRRERALLWKDGGQNAERGAFPVAVLGKETAAYEYCEMETDRWDSGVRIPMFE